MTTKKHTENELEIFKPDDSQTKLAAHRSVQWTKRLEIVVWGIVALSGASTTWLYAISKLP